MSLINRQNQSVSMATIIETPSSIWMQGQEHDASTLTPLFGKQFFPFVSNTNTNGMIYTKYSGTVGSCLNNGSHTDRNADYLAFNLEDFNRGMKDVSGYRWSDGFNYYNVEYGGYRMYRFNPSNQNLTYALVNRPNATTEFQPYDCGYWYFSTHENFVLDEDSTNVYLFGSTHRNSAIRVAYNCADNDTSRLYRRLTKQFVYFNKTTFSAVNDSSPIAHNGNCFHCYIGRSSTRIFVFRSKDDQNTTDLLMYNKSTNTVTTVESLTHSGSHTPIPSETFDVDGSGSFGFYYSSVIPTGNPSGSINAKFIIRRTIFNNNGSQASGSSGPSVVAYSVPCSIDWSLSGSLSPNDLWPNSWGSNTQRYFTRRTKLFLNSPSADKKYLIAFNVTPFGNDDSNKNFYNALVFEISSSNTSNLTYCGYDPVYTDLGGEPRGVIAMDANTNRFLVVTTNNMGIYTFDTSSKSLTLAQTIPGEWRHYGVDTYGRLWATNLANDLFCFTLDSPVRINLTSPTGSYTYTGTNISSSVLVEARNYVGSRVAVPTRLTIEGTSAVFSDNNLTYIDVTTSTGSALSVPIIINNGGFTRIVASSNF